MDTTLLLPKLDFSNSNQQTLEDLMLRRERNRVLPKDPRQSEQEELDYLRSAMDYTSKLQEPEVVTGTPGSSLSDNLNAVATGAASMTNQMLEGASNLASNIGSAVYNTAPQVIDRAAEIVDPAHNPVLRTAGAYGEVVRQFGQGLATTVPTGLLSLSSFMNRTAEDIAKRGPLPSEGRTEQELVAYMRPGVLEAEKVQKDYSYTPKTELGKQTGEAISTVLNLPSKFADYSEDAALALGASTQQARNVGAAVEIIGFVAGDNLFRSSVRGIRSKIADVNTKLRAAEGNPKLVNEVSNSAQELIEIVNDSPQIKTALDEARIREANKTTVAEPTVPEVTPTVAPEVAPAPVSATPVEAAVPAITPEAPIVEAPVATPVATDINAKIAKLSDPALTIGDGNRLLSDIKADAVEAGNGNLQAGLAKLGLDKDTVEMLTPELKRVPARKAQVAAPESPVAETTIPEGEMVVKPTSVETSTTNPAEVAAPISRAMPETLANKLELINDPNTPAETRTRLLAELKGEVRATLGQFDSTRKGLENFGLNEQQIAALEPELKKVKAKKVERPVDTPPVSAEPVVQPEAIPEVIDPTLAVKKPSRKRARKVIETEPEITSEIVTPERTNEVVPEGTNFAPRDERLNKLYNTAIDESLPKQIRQQADSDLWKQTNRTGVDHEIALQYSGFTPAEITKLYEVRARGTGAPIPEVKSIEPGVSTPSRTVEAGVVSTPEPIITITPQLRSAVNNASVTLIDPQSSPSKIAAAKKVIADFGEGDVPAALERLGYARKSALEINNIVNPISARAGAETTRATPSPTRRQFSTVQNLNELDEIPDATSSMADKPSSVIAPVQVMYENGQPAGIVLNPVGFDTNTPVETLRRQAPNDPVSKMILDKVEAKARLLDITPEQAQKVSAQELLNEVTRRAADKNLPVYRQRSGGKLEEIPREHIEVSAKLNDGNINEPKKLTTEQRSNYVEEKTRATGEVKEATLVEALERLEDISDRLPPEIAPLYKQALEMRSRKLKIAERRQLGEVIEDMKNLLDPRRNERPASIGSLLGDQRGSIGDYGLTVRQRLAYQNLKADAIRAGQDILEFIKGHPNLDTVEKKLFEIYDRSLKNPLEDMRTNRGTITAQAQAIDPAAYARGDRVLQPEEGKVAGTFRPLVWAGEQVQLQNAKELQTGHTLNIRPKQFQTGGTRKLNDAGLQELNVAGRNVHRNMELERKRFHEDLQELGSLYSSEQQRAIGVHGLAQDQRGLDLLTSMKITPRTLTPHEMAGYQILRNLYESFFERINETRASIGEKPMNYEQNYFTHMRTFSLLEEFDIKPNVVLDQPETLSIRTTQRNMTPFRFGKERVGSGVYPIETNAFTIMAGYGDLAIRNINISPFTAKINELVNKPRPRLDASGVEIPGAPEFNLKLEKPQLHAVLNDWNTAMAGLDDPKKIIEDRGLRKFLSTTNKMFASSAVDFNPRSMGIQPTVLYGTWIEVGTRPIVEAIANYVRDIPSGANRARLLENSKLLDTRNLRVAQERFVQSLQDINLGKYTIEYRKLEVRG